MADIASILLKDLYNGADVVPTVPSKGLGAMTGRNSVTTEKDTQDQMQPSGVSAVADYVRSIFKQQVAADTSIAASAKSIPFDPSVDDIDSLVANGYNPEDVLKASIATGSASATGRRSIRSETMDDLERLVRETQEARKPKTTRRSVSSQVLDMLATELNRGMTSKQTDTQPTVSADSGRDRFELQGEMRDIPVLEDEDAPELDTRSNELLDKELPSAGLGSRPVAEGVLPLSKGEIRDDDFEPPKEEVKEVKRIKSTQKTLNDLGFKAGAADGKLGGGTRRAVRKFQKANGLEVTGIITPEVLTVIRSNEAVQYPDPPKPDAKVENISDSNFEVFKEAVAQKESSGRYNIMGGANDHYVGRYQMGKSALADVKYDYGKREALLQDNKKQDELFKKYTLQNHRHLTKNSGAYRSMSEKEKLGVLGYAHNQGATAAEEWLYTGVSGKDAFGTLGNEYTSLVADAFTNLSSVPDPLASIRPRARPDTRIASN